MIPTNEVLAHHPREENWQPFLALATQEVFEIMLGSKLEPVSPNGPQTPVTQFTAMVGLAGQLCGVLSLRCSTQSATRMACKMLGLGPNEVDQHMWDAVGEVCNMVAGNFKNKLVGLSEHCMLSVPTVITGADYCLHSLADGGSLEVVLIFEGEPIVVALELHT